MSTIKKETKSPALLKLPIYSTEVAAVIFFLKSTVLNAQKHLQRSNSFTVNVLISQFLNSSCSFYFLSGFSFTKIYDSQDSRGRGEVFCLTPLYHFYPLCRHLNISGTATAGSSPLHIASSRTRTGNLWLPSTNHKPLTYMPSKLQLFIKYRTSSE